MLRGNNQEKSERGFQTPEQVLKQAVLDTRRFDEEREAVENSKDGESVKNKLIERAENAYF